MPPPAGYTDITSPLNGILNENFDLLGSLVATQYTSLTVTKGHTTGTINGIYYDGNSTWYFSNTQDNRDARNVIENFREGGRTFTLRKPDNTLLFI